MERKDYAEKFQQVKNEILEEIRKLIPCNNAHRFKEPFYIHYVNGEVATNELCKEVEVWNDGMVVFIVDSGTHEEEVIEGEDVFQYDPESFLDILDHLQKEVRERKLSVLRELVKKNGGKINFDGSFGFHSIVVDDHVAGEKSFLTCIELDNTYENRVYLDCNFSGEKVEEQEESIPLDELDSLIVYVKSQMKQKFVIRVSGSYSRTFDIEASTYEEALAEAKKDWEINPLCFDDSNGETWEDYTTHAH